MERRIERKRISFIRFYIYFNVVLLKDKQKLIINHFLI